jgi:hypothetical protein
MTVEVAALSLISFRQRQRIQRIPHKPLEKGMLEAGLPENAFSAQTPFKMSVLAEGGGSSFYR